MHEGSEGFTSELFREEIKSLLTPELCGDVQLCFNRFTRGKKLWTKSPACTPTRTFFTGKFHQRATAKFRRRNAAYFRVTETLRSEYFKKIKGPRAAPLKKGEKQMNFHICLFSVKEVEVASGGIQHQRAHMLM